MRKTMNWLLENSLWFISFGLMIASSGIDGAYMMRWMPGGWEWMGLVLNTTSDIAGMILMYWYGRIQQGRSKKRAKLGSFLLGAEITAISYSWFFSWRQLRFILPQVETQDWQWVSWVAAGFIPLLLAFIGYAQSLLAGHFDVPQRSADTRKADATAESQEADIATPEEISEPLQAVAEELEAIAEKPKATIGDWRQLLTQLDGNRRQMTAQDVASELEREGYACPSLRTLSNWAKLAQQAEEVTS